MRSTSHRTNIVTCLWSTLPTYSTSGDVSTTPFSSCAKLSTSTHWRYVTVLPLARLLHLASYVMSRVFVCVVVGYALPPRKLVVCQQQQHVGCGVPLRRVPLPRSSPSQRHERPSCHCSTHPFTSYTPLASLRFMCKERGVYNMLAVSREVSPSVSE